MARLLTYISCTRDSDVELRLRTEHVEIPPPPPPPPPPSFSRCVGSGVRHALEDGHVSRRSVREDEGKGTRAFLPSAWLLMLFMSVSLLCILTGLTPYFDSWQINAVRAVVPNKSNNEIALVLQHFENSVDRAVQAFVEGTHTHSFKPHVFRKV